MRKAFCWLIILLLLSGTAVSMAESAAAAPGLEKFIVRNGDRENSGAVQAVWDHRYILPQRV